MKTSIKVSALGLFLILFQFCSSSTESSKTTGKAVVEPPTIAIYGSNTCDHCVDFKAKLDSIGLKYSFNDVEVNEDQALVMMQLVRNANYQGRINFPVVFVNDSKLLVAPDFEDFMDQL
jgi:glutaredoxin